jgi:ethanolamine permease
LSTLQKTLGPLAIWGLGVGYVISGMYFGWNLGLPEGGPYGLLLATGIATILYIAFVLGYAELACALPRAGGSFVYASRAFGANIGFITGIAQVVEYILGPSAIAFAVGGYINQEFPSVPPHLTAFATYVVFTAINIWGVKLSAMFEIVLTILAVIELCVFGVVVIPHFSWVTFSIDALPHGWIGAFAALPFAIWFYLGIEGLGNVAEEARNPQRDLPRGFFAVMATLIFLTALTLFGAVGSSGWHEIVFPDPTHPLVTSDSPLPLAIAHVVARDSAYFKILTGVGLVGLIASFHGIVIASSRAIMELGRAKFLPAMLGEIHPGRRTPVNALIANMLVGMVAILTGQTNQIILLSVFGALTMYILAAASVIKLRRSEPDLERPYRAPLYPITPVVAIGLSAVCFAAMIKGHPWLALLYAAILGVSWLGFVLFVPAERRATFRSG